MHRWQVKTAARTIIVEARFAEIRSGGVLAFTDGVMEPTKRAFARHAWTEFELMETPPKEDS